MKKHISKLTVILSIAVMLVFVACGDNKTTDKEPQNDSSNSVVEDIIVNVDENISDSNDEDVDDKVIDDAVVNGDTVVKDENMTTDDGETAPELPDTSSEKSGLEGRYWLVDGGVMAYYFDGSMYKYRYAGEETTGSFNIYMDVIWLDDLTPLGSYQIDGNKLIITDEWGSTFTWTEITEEEYNNL